MKIDIHTHTRKCKKGDAPGREITAAAFCSIVSATDVGIICITNHNVFDLDQFQKIQSGLSPQQQAWPGIELDVVTDEGRGHLLVIVSPNVAQAFSQAAIALTKNAAPDSFETSIAGVLKSFEPFHPVYVAHYKQKKPSISDEALAELISKTNHPEQVIKEVTNAISAGIYISHGHSSIHGSDHHDWTHYDEYTKELPDLRLPVDSFEHFCLLLKKDYVAINTALNRKTSEQLSLIPFDDGKVLTLKAFDDINVIFGQKGTGKSCILRAIAKHYASKGIDATVFEPASDKLEEIFDIKGADLAINLNDFGINYCTTEIAQIRSGSETVITSLSKYANHFAATNTNKNAKKLKLKDIAPEKIAPNKREFEEFNKAEKTTSDFLEFFSENSAIRKVLDAADFNAMEKLLNTLLSGLQTGSQATFAAWKEIALLNSAIKKFRAEVEKKTGTPAKPTTTGFRDYALNRVGIEVAAKAILAVVATAIPADSQPVGDLGSNKGQLELITEFRIHDGKVSDGSWLSFSKNKKGSQKDFVNCLRNILEHAYDNELFQYIAQLNEIDEIERIPTVLELLLFKRYFSLDGVAYKPSSGESSMVMLQKELGTDRDVYILDEPERSLGNEYINDVIVPLIKGHARAGKKVFISTHDANIAVRTLPYSSVYRSHGKSGYLTHVGNPFTNNLINTANSADQLEWKKISMRTLEGGEEAFGERGRIYGNN